MASPVLPQSQQSSARLPGTWRLDPARAVTLRPREDGVLRIAHGRVWLTFDGPHAGPPNDMGDRVVGAGEQVRVRAGQRLVMESCESRAPAYFSWDVASGPVADRVAPLHAVAQSWGDLRLAAGFGLRAAGRLAGALVALGVGPCCRVLPPTAGP